jgi:hypothetical protein
MTTLLYRYHKFVALFLNFFLLSVSFLVVAWILPSPFDFLISHYSLPFLCFSIIWLSISYFLGKYNLLNFNQSIYLFISIASTALIVFSVISIILFSFKILGYSRLLVGGTVLLSFILEVIFIPSLYFWLKYKSIVYGNFKQDDPIVVENGAIPITNQELRHTQISKPKKEQSRKAIIDEEAGPGVYEFLAENLNIEADSVVLNSTTTPFNIMNIPGKNLGGIVNFKKVNDTRYINKLFKAVNAKLTDDAGIYVGCVETNKQRHARIEKYYPPILRQFVLLHDFILHRILPKSILFKKLYFALTGGVKRAISQAEVFGRLVSCGFEIIGFKEINNLTYFVVIKTGEPDTNPNHSYGLLFKMPRVGKDGKTILVYKFRTMHPYSEYLQDYVLKLNGYSENGKPANDFRLTSWGRFMRRLWLDEFPQLINVLKGEMNLVGIRPLSKRVLKDYPEDLKIIRSKFKPGCIPPYVSLLMQGLKESIEAERKYLAEKELNPFGTDLKYFAMALYNIMTNKIRSA